MKRITATVVIFFLIAGALTGCGLNQDKIIKDFNSILTKTASEESIKEATGYLDKYLSKVDRKYANEMVTDLEAYILSFDQDGIDYEDWLARCKQYVSPALVGLYEIKLKEQKSPIAKDAVLQVSYEELLQRTYDMELFIQKNKKQKLIEKDAAWIYANYMNALVMGTNGTPIFDYKTNKFSESAKLAYEAFINRYSSSMTAWALTEYFTYLYSTQYTMDYKDAVASKSFFDTCNWLVAESGKRVFQ